MPDRDLSWSYLHCYGAGSSGLGLPSNHLAAADRVAPTRALRMLVVQVRRYSKEPLGRADTLHADSHMEHGGSKLVVWAERSAHAAVSRRARNDTLVAAKVSIMVLI